MALAPWLGACVAATPPDGTTPPAEKAIATIHASRCGACHTPPDPRTRTRAYVEEALSRHRKRVRLSSEGWTEMTNYLAIPEGKTARQP
jgi:hypothetical protein